jgi:hypothetical protein
MIDERRLNDHDETLRDETLEVWNTLFPSSERERVAGNSASRRNS